MAKEEKTIEKIEKVKHASIYEALAAFQGEELSIKKTKQFGKDTDAMKFMYASLDDVLDVVRPLTSKHGLSFTWQEAAEGKIQCVLYHETYANGEVSTVEKGDDPLQKDARVTTTTQEKNVIRSMPVTVARSGAMRTIGDNSTYARRYTLCEVLGVASEEDKDAPVAEESAQNASKTAFSLMKEKIEKGDKEKIEKQVGIINRELATIKAKKAPQLGLKKEQYEELLHIAEARISALGVKEDAEVEQEGLPGIQTGDE